MVQACCKLMPRESGEHLFRAAALGHTDLLFSSVVENFSLFVFGFSPRMLGTVNVRGPTTNKTAEFGAMFILSFY